MSDALAFALKKVLSNAPTDNEHFLSTFATDLLLTQKISYITAGAEYIGFALPGTPQGSPKWMIKKLTYDGSNRVTDIQFANGILAFDQVWTNRASLTYS